MRAERQPAASSNGGLIPRGYAHLTSEHQELIKILAAVAVEKYEAGLIVGGAEQIAEEGTSCILTTSSST